MFNRQLTILFTSSALLLSGCASGTFKERQDKRERLAASTGMFCEFISGDQFPDVDVELSMKMANRCDAGKNFSVTNYKNTSDQVGVIYCCATVNKSEKKSASVPASAAAKPVTPAATPGAPKADAAGSMDIE